MNQVLVAHKKCTLKNLKKQITMLQVKFFKKLKIVLQVYEIKVKP